MKLWETLRNRDEQGGGDGPMYARLAFAGVTIVAVMVPAGIDAASEPKQNCPPLVETHTVNDGESFSFDGNDGNVAADLTVKNIGGELQFTYSDPGARNDNQLPRKGDFIVGPTFVGSGTLKDNANVLTVRYPATSACQ
ncbi:MAG: hypothetical protein V4702_03270 [Patescibacteria group bacterium]